MYVEQHAYHSDVETRMHSSGMRTACLLTISQHALHRGVSAWGGGVYLGGVCQGVSAQGGVSQHAMGQTPLPLWTDRHLWKHNLRKLRLRAVIILVRQSSYFDKGIGFVMATQSCRHQKNRLWIYVSRSLISVLKSTFVRGGVKKHLFNTEKASFYLTTQLQWRQRTSKPPMAWV